MRRLRLLLLLWFLGTMPPGRETTPGSGFTQLEAVVASAGLRTTDTATRAFRSPARGKRGLARPVGPLVGPSPVARAVVIVGERLTSPRCSQGPPRLASS